jgi:hypothetical protein
MVESETCKLARLKPDANPLLADALLSVWVVLLNLKGFTMNLGVGKKKINKSRGGKNSLLGGKKKLSLVSFGQGVGYWQLARVCFFCAFAYFLPEG